MVSLLRITFLNKVIRRNCTTIIGFPHRPPSPGQEWPSTCLLNVGQAHENFTDLEGASAAEFLPVSCGVSGYIPDDTEWARNRDYFGAP